MSFNPNHNATNIDQDAVDEKLPIKLGLILLGFTIFFLFICLLFIVCRRLRKYQRLLEDDEDGEYGEYADDDDDDEVTEFDKEKYRLTAFNRHKCRNRTIKQSTIPKTEYANVEQGQELLNAFSIGDEVDVEEVDANTEKKEGDASNGREDEGQDTLMDLVPPPMKTREYEYIKLEPITVVTKAVPAQLGNQLQQHKLSEEMEQINRCIGSSIDEKQCVQTSLMESMETGEAKPPRSTMRRVSSTPNLQLSTIQNLTTIHMKSIKDESVEDKVSLDDVKLFTDGCTEDELDMACADDTLILDDENNAVNLNQTTGSIGDIGSLRPLLPIRLPDWAQVTGKPERGFMVFALSINEKPGQVGPPKKGDLSMRRFLIDVRVLEVRCVLSKHTEPKAGKFYVKARIQQAGAPSNAMSTLSLDQLPTKSSPLGLSNMFFRSGRYISAARTSVRRALRSPVFWQAVTLETEYPSTPLAQRDTGSLELKLDLKERDAVRTDSLFGHSSGLSGLPIWKQSQLIGSVRLPLDSRIWNHFIGGVKPLDRSTLVPSILEDEQVDYDDNAQEDDIVRESGVIPPRILRFVRPFEVSMEESIDRGDLTIGIQYNPEAGKMTLNPLKCIDIHLPKGAKSIFLRATLMSNRKIIATLQTNPSARLTMNAAEFLLGERIQFMVEEHLSQVCLLFSVFARSGRRINEATSLIGRCCIGPTGLAYGEGLSHWQAISTQRGMVKRTHILF